MLRFHVKKSRNWYIATCSELGLAISGTEIISFQNTADRAARARGYEAVSFDRVELDTGIRGRFCRLLKSFDKALRESDPARAIRSLINSASTVASPDSREPHS